MDLAKRYKAVKDVRKHLGDDYRKAVGRDVAACYEAREIARDRLGRQPTNEEVARVMDEQYKGKGDRSRSTLREMWPEYER
jgi:hypothetical protein